MKKRYFSNIITFLLFTLMIFKVSSFHAYTHDDDTSDEIENCNICELAAEIQDNKFVIATQVVVTTPLLTIHTYEPVTSYDLVLSSSFLRSSFFGRPPPTCG